MVGLRRGPSGVRSRGLLTGLEAAVSPRPTPAACSSLRGACGQRTPPTRECKLDTSARTAADRGRLLGQPDAARAWKGAPLHAMHAVRSGSGVPHGGRQNRPGSPAPQHLLAPAEPPARKTSPSLLQGRDAADPEEADAGVERPRFQCEADGACLAWSACPAARRGPACRLAGSACTGCASQALLFRPHCSSLRVLWAWARPTSTC